MEETELSLFSGLFSPQPADLRSSVPQGIVPRLREGQTPRVPPVIESQLSTPGESPTTTPGRTRFRNSALVLRRYGDLESDFSRMLELERLGSSPGLWLSEVTTLSTFLNTSMLADLRIIIYCFWLS